MKIKQLLIVLTLGLGLTLALLTILGGQGTAQAAGAIIRVANSGSDAAGCGGTSNPCLTIQYAVNNRTVAGDEIWVAGGTYTDVGPQGVVDLTSRNLTIRGGYDAADWAAAPDPDLNPTVVDGEDARRVFYIYASSVVTLENLEIMNGSLTSANGAGIYSDDSQVTLNTCTIEDNAIIAGVGSGGGIYIAGGMMTMTNSSIIGNLVATDNGGGLAAFNSNVWISDSEIEGNITTNGLGGGIYNQTSIIRVFDSTINGNIAGNKGGGVYSQWLGTVTTLTGVTLDNNTAGNNGGGVENINQAAAAIISSTINNNEATTFFGGGVSNEISGQVEIIASTLSGNQAGTNGGGVYNTDFGSTVALTNSTLSGNTANTFGGGVYNNSDATLALMSTTLADNAAGTGGGLHNNGTGAITARNTIVANSLNGGDCFNNGTGSTTSLGNNLASDGSCLAFFTHPTDQNNTDPLLGPLQDNSGDTHTHALLLGSPAIDAGTCAGIILTDQRELGRPAGPSTLCDIGAYEAYFANIALTKTVNITQPQEGELIRYTITAANQGPDDSLTTVLTDILPTGLSYVTHTTTAGTYGSATGLWTLDNILPGDSALLVITATVNAGTNWQLITNTVTLSSVQDIDPTSTNNTAFVTLQVINAPDLLLSKEATLEPAYVNEPLTYTLRITNIGSVTATDVTLTDYLPSVALPLLISPTRGSCESSPNISCYLGTLLAGEQATVTLVVSPTAPGPLSNLAMVSESDVDPNPDNNHSLIATTVEIRQPITNIYFSKHQSLGNSNSQGATIGPIAATGPIALSLSAAAAVCASDIAVANNGSPNSVWLNDGNGTFSNSGQSLGDEDTNAVALGDLDADGDMDLLFGNALSQANTLWLNDGSGVFSDSGQSLGEGNTQAIALGDLDGDGFLDAVIGNNDGTAGNQIRLNNGTGTFSAISQNLGNASTQAIALGDLDADGDLDAFIGNNQEQASQIWLNNGGGAFSNSGQNIGNGDSNAVALGDLNGDGYLDLFSGNQGNDALWLNDGTGTFTQSNQTFGDSNTQAVALGDLDGDGDLDLAAGGVGTTEIWLNDGTGSFVQNAQFAFDSPDSQAILLQDLDCDGDLDAFIANDNGNPDTVWLNGDRPAPTIYLPLIWKN
jgi:uncharacterized repeat protein (TIGR01451 family)